MLGNKTPWLLATGWDDQSIDLILARHDGKQLTIVAAESHQRTDNAPGDVGAVLSNALKKHGARRPFVAVALPRSRAEVISVSLPPASDEELLDLVPLQVEQIAPEHVSEDVFDFVPLHRNETAGREVIVVAPRPNTMTKVESELKAAGLKANVVGFRPLGLLPLIDKTGAHKSHRSLAFCLEPGAADILLLDRGHLVLSRAVRLPNRADPTFASNLIGELRRTAMVLPHQGGTVTELEHVYGFGSGDEFDELIGLLNQDTAVSVTRVNPFRVANDETKERVMSSRFAPLIGMLLGQQDDSNHAVVDFLNPRRPAAQPSRWRRVAFYAALAAALLGALIYYVWDTRKSLDEEVARLNDDLAKVEKMADKIGRQQTVAQSIADWQSDDVNWIDELRDLSIRFPGPDEAIVRRMSITPVDQGNLVTMQLRVKSPSVVTMMEANLRDEYHSVKSKRVSEVAGAEQFPWQLDTTILVSPRPPEAYTQHLEIVKQEAL